MSEEILTSQNNTEEVKETSVSEETSILSSVESDKKDTTETTETTDQNTDKVTQEKETKSEESESDGSEKHAPDEYEDFKLPEGFDADPDITNSFKELAKKFDLTQGEAQELIDFSIQQAQKSTESQQAIYENTIKEWKEQVKNDLGVNFDKELAYAAKTRQRFSNPELDKFLDDSGLGNHPSLVKLYIAVGKAISEDNFESGGETKGASKAQSLYPSMPNP